jgi:hypothetical protein
VGSGNELSDHVVQFQTSTSRNGRDTLAFPSGRQFVLTHTGGPANLSLTLSGFTAAGLPVAAQLPSIRLINGETLRAAPSSWRALGSAVVTLTSTVHGRTMVKSVRGRLIGGRFASIKRARLISLGHGRYRVALAMRIRRAPAQGWLSIAVLAMRGHRVLERAVPIQLSGGSLRTGTVLLTLPNRLGHGRDSLVIHLLEATPRGLAQGSVLVSRQVKAVVR